MSAVRVFLVFLVAYGLTWGGHYTTADGSVKLAWARALVNRASADIDPGPDFAVSKYGIGHSLVAAVPVLASRAVEPAIGPGAEVIAYTLVFVANGAAFLALLAVYARRHYAPARVWALVCAIGFGTMWWPYTKLDFTEPLVATCLFAGFVAVRAGWPTVGVLLASFCGLLRPDAFLLAGFLAGWTIWTRGSGGRAAAAIAASLGPAVAVHLATTAWRYGTPWVTYPGETFTTPLGVGLWGLLLSAGKSVFLYSPPLVLGIAGARAFAREDRARAEDTAFFVGVLVLQVLLYAGWWDWSGDDSWGPRLVLPGATLACIPMATLLQRKLLATALVSVGILVQLEAVLVSPLDYVMLVRRTDARRVSLFSGERTRLDFEDIRFNPRYSPVVGHFIMVRLLFGSGPRPDAADERRVGTALEAAFPPSAWSAAARWDPLSIRGLQCLRTQRGASFRSCLATR